MVVIRLAHRGAKKYPFYDIVVTDSRNSRDGKFIEKLGYFNPVARGKSIKLRLNTERIDQWIQKGAQVSDRVKKLLKDHKKSKAA